MNHLIPTTMLALALLSGNALAEADERDYPPGYSAEKHERHDEKIRERNRKEESTGYRRYRNRPYDAEGYRPGTKHRDEDYRPRRLDW